MQTTQGGLFGPAQQQQQQQPSSVANTGAGGLFGAGASTLGGGLFGSKPAGNLLGTVNTSTSNASSLFPGLGGGQQQQQQNQQLQFQQPQQPQQQQQQQQQRPLFGTTLNQPSLLTGSTSTLGAQNIQNSLLSSRTTTLPAQQQHDTQTQFALLTQKIEDIVQAWNASSPQCRFQVRFSALTSYVQCYCTETGTLATVS